MDTWTKTISPFHLLKGKTWIKFFLSLHTPEILGKQDTFSDTQHKHNLFKPIGIVSFRLGHVTCLINEMWRNNCGQQAVRWDLSNSFLNLKRQRKWSLSSSIGYLVSGWETWDYGKHLSILREIWQGQGYEKGQSTKKEKNRPLMMSVSH